ncbi:MAG: MFS transporter, partial [Caldilineales bacterium]|nr:MFS transporter [Caldilineales bacterium]
GGTVAQVGLVSALGSAVGAPAALAWGWLSDRVGSRKLYLALGFLGFGLPTLLMGFSQDVAQFVLLTVLVGAWSVAGTPVSSTLIMDLVPKEEWEDAFGHFNQIAGWGVVIGRVLGLGWIAYVTVWLGNALAQRSLWWLSGALGLVSVVLAWWWTPRLYAPKPHSLRGRLAAARQKGIPHLLTALRTRWNGLNAGRTSPRQWVPMLREPLIAYYLATFVLFTASVFAYTVFAVWQRQELGNTTTSVFLMGLINSLAATLFYRWMGRRAGRRGSMGIQILAVVLRVGVFGGFALVSVLALRGWSAELTLAVLQAISGFSWAGIAVGGNAAVAHLAPKGNEGAAVGAYNTFVSLGSILGAFASGYVAEWTSFAAVFLLGALGMALTTALLVLIRRQAHNRGLAQM